jgi:hypothetical protein
MSDQKILLLIIWAGFAVAEFIVMAMLVVHFRLNHGLPRLPLPPVPLPPPPMLPEEFDAWMAERKRRWIEAGRPIPPIPERQ